MVLFSAVPSVRQPEQPLPPEIIENTIATMIAVVMTTMIAGLTGSLVAISAHRARRKRATAETRHAGLKSWIQENWDRPIFRGF
jgi:hypothetical protein